MGGHLSLAETVMVSQPRPSSCYGIVVAVYGGGFRFSLVLVLLLFLHGVLRSDGSCSEACTVLSLFRRVSKFM